MPDERPVVANPDFNDIKQFIISHFKADATFAEYDFKGSAMNTIIDILAYNTHYNNLAANYLINESFLDTALMRNNIISISKMLNYTPRSKQAAKAKITLRIPKINGTNVYTIPTGSLFTATDGTTTFNFYTLKNFSVQFDAADANGTTRDVEVDICEGDKITQRFSATADHTSFPRFELGNKNIDTTSINVSVNGSLWTQVTNETQGTTDVSNLSTIYFVEESRNLSHNLMFGNGVLGKKLEVGDEVLATYLVTNGSDANGVNSFSVAIQGRSDITVVSTKAATGGGDMETIQEIKDLSLIHI